MQSVVKQHKNGSELEHYSKGTTLLHFHFWVEGEQMFQCSS